MLKTFSEDLKYFRESKNMTLKDVALDTRLNMAVLENLENGDFTFQPQTYIRAFLRQYAKSIGLNPDTILKDYETAKLGNYSTKRLPPEEKLEAFEKIKEEKKEEQPKLEVKKTKPEEIKEEERKEEKDEVFDKFNIDEFKKPVENEKTKPVDDEKEIKKQEEKKETKKKTEEFNFPPPREKKPIDIQRETEDKKNVTADPDKRYIVKTKNVNSSFLKTAFIVIIFLLIGAGVYSLVNILFLNNNNKGPEIQRKSFDEVVKENEKKILGKKTPEEIQDSIKKAEEEKQKLLAAKNDSLTMEISANKKTWVIVDADSNTINDPKRIYIEKGESEVFKAKRIFHIGTPNSDLIEVTLNGKTLEFDRKNFRNLPIDKNGISEK
ncbi:MAG: helix-turn-helix domain-containing protein [Ignavibacteria bacterium]|nr:helix-turn-helix domain-containing protein [Ignavibacteria bacterium]